MSNLASIIENSYGYVFQITVEEDGVAVDISSFTTLEILLCDPNGTTTTKSAIFYTDGSEGILVYSVVDGDINQEGAWSLQVKLSRTGQVMYSSVVVISVGSRLI